jgi:hypothetical protein
MGYQKQYHILSREVCRSLHQRPALMSTLGQQRTWRDQISMSALPPKADIRPRDQDVCFGPKADIRGAANVVQQKQPYSITSSGAFQ